MMDTNEILLLLLLISPVGSDKRVEMRTAVQGGIIPCESIDVVLSCNPKPELVHQRLEQLTIIKKAGNVEKWMAKVARHKYVIDTSIANPEFPIWSNGSIGTEHNLIINWPVASFDTFGTYYCEAQIVDDKGKTQIVPSDDVHIGDLDDLWRLVSLYSLETAVCSDEGLVPHGQPRINFTTDMAATPKTIGSPYFPDGLPVGINALRLLLWPRGRYALLAPATGCPTEDLGEWAKGSLRESTNSDRRRENRNKLSKPSHLKWNFFSQYQLTRTANWEFCVKQRDQVSSFHWPRGSFCIFKTKACPLDMKSGNIFLDDEDKANLNKAKQPLPQGHFEQNTEFYFCCREDGRATREIYLPRFNPFYLFRKRGTCQKVFGMEVTNEFIEISTELSGSENSKNGSVPDTVISREMVRFELCYYTATQYYSPHQ